MRPRGNKAPATAIAARQERVYRLTLRGISLRRILEGFREEGIQISKATLERDIASVRKSLLATKQASELYSLNKAFTELDELWREGWSLYGRKPQQIETKHGIVAVDDRGIKTLLLRELRGIVHERAQMLGYFTPKVLERITMVETAAGRGVRIERIPYDEQLKRSVEELRSNEGLARSEGLIP